MSLGISPQIFVICISFPAIFFYNALSVFFLLIGHYYVDSGHILCCYWFLWSVLTSRSLSPLFPFLLMTISSYRNFTVFIFRGCSLQIAFGFLLVLPSPLNTILICGDPFFFPSVELGETLVQGLPFFFFFFSICSGMNARLDKGFLLEWVGFLFFPGKHRFCAWMREWMKKAMSFLPCRDGGLLWRIEWVREWIRVLSLTFQKPWAQKPPSSQWSLFLSKQAQWGSADDPTRSSRACARVHVCMCVCVEREGEEGKEGGWGSIEENLNALHSLLGGVTGRGFSSTGAPLWAQLPESPLSVGTWYSCLPMSLLVSLLLKTHLFCSQGLGFSIVIFQSSGVCQLDC